MLHNCADVIILTMNFKQNNIFYSDLIIYFKSTFWRKENLDKMFFIHIFSHFLKKTGMWRLYIFMHAYTHSYTILLNYSIYHFDALF